MRQLLEALRPSIGASAGKLPADTLRVQSETNVVEAVRADDWRVFGATHEAYPIIMPYYVFSNSLICNTFRTVKPSKLNFSRQLRNVVRYTSQFLRNLPYWQVMVENFRGSGMACRQFCEDHEISAATFYYWRKKLDCASERLSFGKNASIGSSFRILRITSPESCPGNSGGPPIICQAADARP